MFNKDNKMERFKDAETIIGGSIKVKGNFQGQGDIVIEGSIEGSLKTEANLFIGSQAKVVASIEAKDATINGEVRGNIKAKNYLAIGENAKIFGDIQYGEISISRGAIINGQLLMLGEEQRKSSKNSDNKREEAEDNEA
jgi:cytoskeletal protein CcmA (bactofilin family)